MKTVELDEGEPLPDWRALAATMVMGGAYEEDVQPLARRGEAPHPRGGASLPAYAQSLERIQGPGALERAMDEVGGHASSTIPLARGMFGRWLERVARVPAQAIG